MRWMTPAAALLLLTAGHASAHGALELNEFDTYAISDFEGMEESFPWEGWEIWDIYAGDGYNLDLDSHGVYFKGNFAGEGTLRPLMGGVWDLAFWFTVGNETYERTVSHDGAEVTTDFEQLEWQIADGNVFQIHAWAPVDDWDGASITDIVVLSSVDGDPRDIAPGGLYIPMTGVEVPVAAPATPIFPPLGEGRVVDAVPLTGSAKFLDVSVQAEGDGWFAFNVTNALAGQGQHFLFDAPASPGWAIHEAPAAESLEGGASTSFRLHLSAGAPAEPQRIDLLTDIGGLQSWYAYVGNDGVAITDDPAMAVMSAPAESANTPAPALGLAFLLVVAVALRRR